VAAQPEQTVGHPMSAYETIFGEKDLSREQLVRLASSPGGEAEAVVHARVSFFKHMLLTKISEYCGPGTTDALIMDLVPEPILATFISEARDTADLVPDNVMLRFIFEAAAEAAAGLQQ
jgi:hypothetical protein